jgi:T5SS/PEP-CTERM-associated repeat protein
MRHFKQEKIALRRLAISPINIRYFLLVVVGSCLIMKRNLLQLWGVRCLLGHFVLAFGITASAEKAWKSPDSGLWADGTNWSGNLPPDITSFIQITNANTKTVTIDAATPAATLTVQMLTISAPPGATNTLLLSDAGTNNPLVFQTGLQLDDGAAIRITNSALVVEIPFFHTDLDGSLTLDSGLLTFSDTTSTARVGRATSGRLIINGGTVQAGTMTVGGLTNSQGMVSMTGGSLGISSLFSIGRNPGTTGTVAMLGGQLSVPNDDTRIGDSGVGQMIVSNATATLTNLIVGHRSLSVGMLTLQNNGTVLLSNDLSIGRFGGSTGSVTVAGGAILASGLKIYVGREGAGQMSISGGGVQASRLLVAANPTNTVSGTFAMSGGNLNLSSELLVGSLSLSAGAVLITGGAITATNSGGAGDVSVPSGNLTLSGGTITTDSVLLTNSAGRMVFNGGVLNTRGTTVANGSAFVVGDGSSAATFNLLGGTHSFANGLIISSNASLTGCGTIIGSIINHGTISTNCGGGSVPPSITMQPVNLTVTQGNNASFSVTATGDPPLSYQWRFGGNNLSGATSTSYTVIGAQAANAGNYDVVVSNNSGSVTSAVATLTVRIPPSVTQQPVSLTVTQGNNASFSVTATGDPPLSYQWRFGGNNLAGATGSSYTVTGAQAANAGN